MTELVWDGKPVKRPCSSCGSFEWYEIRTMIEGTDVLDCCSNCPKPVQVDGVPDVYLSHVGQTFENLTDKMGHPIEIQSKQHKKRVMADLGVREAGDRVNGATYGSKSWTEGTKAWRSKQFDKDRPMIRENIKRYLENKRRER